MLLSHRCYPTRDVLFICIGAFSALSLIVLRDLSPHIQAHFAKPVQLEDTGYYQDWNDEEMTSPLPLRGKGSMQWNASFEILPRTKVINHAPGWTMFKNLYMSNGTLFIVSSEEEKPYEWGAVRDTDGADAWERGFPSRRMMTSTGLPGYASAESMITREPTDKDMQFITEEEAARRWGDRVWEIEGHSWLYNDPNQFLNHFYHYVAESLFGFWMFYAGTLDSAITARGETTAPPPDRAMFIRCDPKDVRDTSKFNSMFMNAAFPSMSIETASNWNDRIFLTRNGDKAWVFSNVVLQDRSASFRGRECGSKNQRIAAEAYRAIEGRTTRWFWEPIRRAVLRFASVPEDIIDIPVSHKASFTRIMPAEERKDWPVILTYVNRQSSRRHLIEAHHEWLVQELADMCQSRGWEFKDVKAEKLTQEEQLALVAKTTILVGVHGNGLSHLISMPPTKLSTVVEIFWPTGFMYDYQWTAMTLGHKHFAIWNDTAMVYPDLPIAATPEGFQSDQIPLYAPIVRRVIEERFDDALASMNS